MLYCYRGPLVFQDGPKVSVVCKVIPQTITPVTGLLLSALSLLSEAGSSSRPCDWRMCVWCPHSLLHVCIVNTVLCCPSSFCRIPTINFSTFSSNVLPPLFFCYLWSKSACVFPIQLSWNSKHSYMYEHRSCQKPLCRIVSLSIIWEKNIFIFLMW